VAKLHNLKTDNRERKKALVRVKNSYLLMTEDSQIFIHKMNISTGMDKQH